MHPFLYPELIDAIREDRLRFWRRGINRVDSSDAFDRELSRRDRH